MKAHPVAELFPMMSEPELQELADDIKAHGLLEKIVTTSDGKLLVDGRNRLEACKRAKVQPAYRPLSKSIDERGIISFICSRNIQRRHLNAGQRAMVAGQLAEKLRPLAEQRQVAAGGDRRSEKAKSVTPGRGGPIKKENRSGEVNRQAAKIMGVGHGTVARAKKVAEESPKLAAKVKSGEISLQKAYDQVNKPANNNNDDGFDKGFKKLWDGLEAYIQMQARLDKCERNDKRIAALEKVIEYTDEVLVGYRRWMKGGRAYKDFTNLIKPQLRVVK